MLWLFACRISSVPLSIGNCSSLVEVNYYLSCWGKSLSLIWLKCSNLCFYPWNRSVEDTKWDSNNYNLCMFHFWCRLICHLIFWLSCQKAWGIYGILRCTFVFFVHHSMQNYQNWIFMLRFYEMFIFMKVDF